MQTTMTAESCEEIMDQIEEVFDDEGYGDREIVVLSFGPSGNDIMHTCDEEQLLKVLKSVVAALEKGPIPDARLN